MTPEQMQELTSLRQYKQETDVYVKRLEDLQDEHRKAITALRIGTDELMAALAERDDRIAEMQRHTTHQAQQIEQLTFALNRAVDAALAKVKAVHEYKVEHGIIDRYDVVNQWD